MEHKEITLEYEEYSANVKAEKRRGIKINRLCDQDY